MTSDDGASAPLLDQAAHGYRATLISQGIRLSCKAASVVVLARLVSPSEHGVFAMAASLFMLLVLFRDLGLGAAAVQAPTLSEEQCSTLWRVHAVVGVALAALAVALAPVLAAFYHEPRVAGLITTMSAGLLIIGGNAWPRVLLTRQLRFAELNRVETIAAVVGTVAAIVAGGLGAGAYAFVAFLLVSEVISLVEAWRLCGWRPTAPVRWASLREIWRTGVNLTGYNVVQYFQQQLDTLLMGRWFGAGALGLYNRPAQLLALPVQHGTAPLTQVLLATLSRLGPDSPEFARHVRSTANLIAHLTLPLAVVCISLPHETVQLILGAAWPEAAPLLRWLAVNAAISYLSATIYGVSVAAGQTRRLALLSLVVLAATGLGLWAGKTSGPAGLAAGLAVTNFALLGPRLWWATRGTPVRLGDFLGSFAGPLGLAAALAAGMLTGHALTTGCQWFVRFGASVLSGGLTGFALVAAWPRLRAEWRLVAQLLPWWPRGRPGNSRP
ncbi:MAG: hypothetical protein EXS32_05170 [Opitutus sp.]|nr:hypothetical protein [Opitutus sp.]